MATKKRTAIKGGSENSSQDVAINKKPKKRLVLKKAMVNEVIIALDTENAAKAIGVSAAMMKKMRSEGTGPMYSRVGTKCVYLVKRLESYLINNTANEY